MSDIWVSGGGGVTDGWMEARDPVPARCLHPWLGPGGPWGWHGALSLAAVPTRQSRPSPVSECQILGSRRGLASALSRESLSSGVGEGSQPGRAPSPGDKKGFRAQGRPGLPGPRCKLSGPGSGPLGRPRWAAGRSCLRGGGGPSRGTEDVKLGTGPSCPGHRLPA